MTHHPSERVRARWRSWCGLPWPRSLVAVAGRRPRTGETREPTIAGMTETDRPPPPAPNAIRWARWRSRPMPCTARRPSGPSSTSRSRASRCRARFLRALALIKLAAAETNARARPARAGRRRRRSRPPRHRSPTATTTTSSRSTSTRPVRRTSTNTNMNEVVAHLAGGPTGRPEGPPERRRQPLPELERHDPDRAPAVGRGRDRGRAAAGPRAAAHGAGRQGAGVLAGRQDRPDASPGRDADPARPGVPRLRRPGRGIDPAGARRPGRAARGAARRDGGRDRDQRPSRSSRSGPAPGCRR